mmetsp:Transcript_151030/g.485364  ORF Transcript_151030/g.485364 Transcript_151030/m.485364 type:complete len:234 (-) Transcript_151030:871-1572(-)
MQAQRWPQGNIAWDLGRSKQTQHSLGSCSPTAGGVGEARPAASASSPSEACGPSPPSASWLQRVSKTRCTALAATEPPLPREAANKASAPPESRLKNSCLARRLVTSSCSNNLAAACAASGTSPNKTSFRMPSTTGCTHRVASSLTATTASRVCVRCWSSSGLPAARAATKRTMTCVKSSTASQRQSTPSGSKTTWEWEQRASKYVSSWRRWRSSMLLLKCEKSQSWGRDRKE